VVGGGPESDLAQVITARLSGVLTEVLFPIEGFGEFTVDLHGVTAEIPNGVVLAFETFSPADFPTSSLAPHACVFEAGVLCFRRSVCRHSELTRRLWCVPGPDGRHAPARTGFFRRAPKPRRSVGTAGRPGGPSVPDDRRTDRGAGARSDWAVYHGRWSPSRQTRGDGSYESPSSGGAAGPAPGGTAGDSSSRMNNGSDRCCAD